MKNTNNIRTSNIATGLKVEKRKHYSQMNTSEIKSLYAKLLSVTTKNWRMSYHAEERLVQKRIDTSRSRIVDVINHCEIIEYKTVDNGRYTCERVIVRDTTLINKNYNLNVVFDVTRGVVISVWLNHVKDRHSTLDMLIYDRELQIL